MPVGNSEILNVYLCFTNSFCSKCPITPGVHTASIVKTDIIMAVKNLPSDLGNLYLCVTCSDNNLPLGN